MRVLLLSMPFGAVDRPALGLSLLKAGLTRAGHHAEVAYPFDRLISRIGLETYQWLTDGLPYTAFAGDWCFTQALYGPDDSRDAGYVRDILVREWQMSKSDIIRLFTARKQVEAYLTDLLTACDWRAWDVVGFTSTFAQNIASLAFAKRLKAAHPNLKVVFGGANWEAGMGAALFDQFPFVDFVCRGEADHSFPMLVDRLAEGGDLSQIPGVLYRGGEGLPAMQVTDMDALPVPDMSDYFTMLRRNGFGVMPTLLMETSRGCWWGAKHHCTFCGLNGNGMAYRSKSAKRALSELDTLTEQSGCGFVSVVDNILDMKYFQDFIPELAKRGDGPTLFYETKANLSRNQVAQLAKAQVRTIQPGIESLSNRVLKLMRKGTSALRNIQLLKWCREMGLSVEWNVLYGFPGERDADYTPMLAMMEKLTHLQPPSGCGPVRFDRFSPYHDTPEAFGLRDLRPLPVFSYLYPHAGGALSEIACYFDSAAPYDIAAPETVQAITGAIAAWEAASRDTLSARDDRQTLHLRDTRKGRQGHYTLRGADRAIYVLCDRIQTPQNLTRALHDLGYGTFDVANMVAFLDQLVQADLVLQDEDSYLALATYDRLPTDLTCRTDETVLVAGAS